jgi:hypothetical protein
MTDQPITTDDMRLGWADATAIGMTQELLPAILKALLHGASGPTYVCGEHEEREVTVVVLPTIAGIAEKVAELVRAEIARG